MRCPLKVEEWGDEVCRGGNDRRAIEPSGTTTARFRYYAVGIRLPAAE